MTDTKDGERIAKVLSRAGAASRREAERMIELGRVTVNGRVIDSPALNVTPADRIAVDGAPLAPPEPARLWLYYKPEGLVTTASDEKGRDTVFDHLPEGLPRVMPVGRLDLNSEGLLLLTNDGELKRRLELPSTGWLRKYRVRIKGNPTDADLEPLRKGITVEGESFQPMTVTLDRLQGANAWLTVGLREGRNREIRRAMSAIGLTVNRLIRISYGPFRLGELQPGEVEEVRPRVLRDQLGTGTEPAAERTKPQPKPRGPGPKAKAPEARTGGSAPAARSGRGPAPGHQGAAPLAKPARSRPAPAGSRVAAVSNAAGPERDGRKPGLAKPGRGPRSAEESTGLERDGRKPGLAKPARPGRGPQDAKKATSPERAERPTASARPARPGRGPRGTELDAPTRRPGGKPPRPPRGRPTR